MRNSVGIKKLERVKVKKLEKDQKWNKENKPEGELRNGKPGEVELELDTEKAKPENWSQKSEIGKNEIRKC